MRNVTEEDLTRLFDEMVSAIEQTDSSANDCAAALTTLARQLVMLGWDETGLPSGQIARSIRKYRDRSWVVLALRLADPEPELLDSHAGFASFLGYDRSLDRWVLRIPDREPQMALPTRDGWNDLVMAWLRVADNAEDYRDGFERYCI
jgi:hypothetical protein